LILQTRLGQLARTQASASKLCEVLLEPTISVLLAAGALEGALPALALELGLRKLLGTPVRFAPAPPFLALASANTLLRVDGPRQILVVDDGVLELWQGKKKKVLALPPSEASTLRMWEPIGDHHALLLHDPNPLAMNEAHPDKSGNALSLGERSVGEWQAALGAALGTIALVLPELSAELGFFHRYFIPVGFEPEKHLSASYREYLGAMYLTLHPSHDTMTEAVIHEFQHNKLNLLSWHDALLENGTTFEYRSPVRPDPRPLLGILLAAHAFVPVAELYHRRLRSGETSVRQRLGEVVAMNEEALAVLATHAAPTPLGRRVLSDLALLHQRHVGP
jgi:HEXXH motif-containing protein